MGDDSGPFQNRWTALLLILVAAALLAGLGLTALPEGPHRSAFFRLTILIAVLMIHHEALPLATPLAFKSRRA
jgi:hypothetical protein